MHSQKQRSVQAASDWHSSKRATQLKSRLRSPKLLLLSLVSVAMLSSSALAEGGALVDVVPQDYSIGEVLELSDEDYVKIPLTDRDQIRRRAELLEMYKPGGSAYPLTIKIDSIEPKGGPTTGTTRVTVRGGPFKDMQLIHPKPVCKFGRTDMVVPATYVTCSPKPTGLDEKEAHRLQKTEWCLQCQDAPPNAEAEIINLSVSVLGDFTDSLDSEPFRYYAPAEVHAIYPHYGPKDGETLVQVWGANFLNFGETTRCNFGSKSVPVHYYNANYLTCRAPESDTTGFAIPFSITMNVQQSSKEVQNYYYYSRPIVAKLTPNYGPSAGGNEVLVQGSGFDPFSELGPKFRMLDDKEANKFKYEEANRMNKNDTFCVFEGVGKTKATIISSTRAVCPAPPSTKDTAELYLTLNNQDYSDDDVPYFWYKAAKLYDINPKYGPTEGGTEVHLFGTDFQKGHQLQCVFDGNLYVNATFVSAQEISCISPPHPPGKVKVQTTVLGDSGKSMSDPLYFTYVQRPIIISIDPPCGPVQGYTQIKVTGKNFQNLGPNMAFCVFNNTHFMNVTLIDEENLYCSSPRLPNNERSLPAGDMIYEVRVTVDNKSTMTKDHKNFGYYFDSELSAVVEADNGPVSGGTQSLLIGKGFTHPNVCNLKVRYGGIEVNPKLLNSTMLQTISPRVNLPGSVVLATSGNGQNYANDITMHYRDKENTFTYTQDILANYIHPQEGPNSGKTKVMVRAIGLAQFKNDDGTVDKTHPLYYRLLTEQGQQINNITAVYDLGNDQFTWYTPPCPPDSKKILLQTSWNKQNWQSIAPVGRNHTFEYYEAPEVQSVNPHFGPVKSPNNETVVITGKNFICYSSKGDCDVKVRFGDKDYGIYVPGTILDETHIQCAVPKYTKPDILPVEITIDGNEYTNNGVTYGFFDAYLLDVRPRLISKNGGTQLTLSGFGFVNAGPGETKTKFSSKSNGELSCGTSPCINEATFVDKNTLLTKSLPQGVLFYTNHTNIGQNGFTVEATVYNNQFTNNNIEVWYIFDPLFKAISRNSTPINLSLPILVTTEFYWESNNYDRFAKYSNFTCRFTVGNQTYVTSARMETMPFGSRYENDALTSDKRILPNHVLCASPRVATPGQGIMDISVNGMDYSGNFKYSFTPPVDVYRIAPGCGPTDQKTRVQLVGTGLQENKETVIQKTGDYETTDLKGAEVKTLAWSEADFLSSMSMTAQDLLTFKYVDHTLQQGEPLQSVFMNIQRIPNLNQTHGGMNSISLGEEIDFTVEKTTERRMLEDAPQIDAVQNPVPVDAAQSAPQVEVALSQQNSTQPAQNQTASQPEQKPASNKIVLASVNAPNYKFTNSQTEFKTYKNPVVKKVFPNIGLTSGGTQLEISGAWFDEQLDFSMMPYCKIGQKVVRGQFISTVRIVCKTPPNDNIVQQQPIYVSLNAVNWVDTGFFFSYYVQPVLLGMTPHYGPMQGGTEILIQGQRFSNITDSEFVKCKFTLIGSDRNAVPKFIPAIYRDEQTMMCVSPNGFQGGESVNLQMTFNGADYTEPKDFLVFNYYTVLGSFPHSGPADGFDEVILVRGSGLKSTDQVICSLNNTNIAPVDVSPNLIQCPMCLPNKDPNAIGLVKFGVQIHGVYNDFGNFYYYDQVKMNSMFPHNGPNEGKGDIFFVGDKFRDDFPGAQLGCKIGDAVGEAVLSEDKTTMKCVIEKMPLAKEGEPFESKIALNSYSWVGTNPPNLYMPYGITDMQPRSGPYEGFTDVFITGGGYTSDLAESARCRFGTDQDYAIVEAQVLDFNRMTCRSPENFKLPTEGSKTISVPFGISFGNDSFHPWTLGFNRYLFYENPYLVEAIPAEVKIGKMAEIFVRADPLKPFIEPVPSGPENVIEPIKCNFEEFGNSMGLYINSTYVMCVSPRISGHPDDYYREEVLVRVAINGQDFQAVGSEAIVTFVGTGQAKGFVHFIIAAILIALLIIVLAFLVIMLILRNQRSLQPQTRYDLRDNNTYQQHRGRPSQGDAGPSRAFGAVSRAGAASRAFNSRQDRLQ